MRLKLLILTPFHTVPGFQRHVYSRKLLWGLEDRGIDWQLHRPWKVPGPEPADFDAVLSWGYGWKLRRRFLPSCGRFEERCRARGVPVINSIRTFSMAHTRYLDLWRLRGIPCAAYQHFSAVDEITLPYPLILRRDETHMGRDMHLVRSPEEARRVVRRRRRELGAEQELDLALEFVDTRRDDGYTYVRRCHVVGDRVFPGHQLRSKSPFVNFTDATLNLETCRLDGRFLARGEDDPEVLRRAARVIDRDIVALDYARRGDGSLVFWEANCHPKTAGDGMASWLEERESDDRHGEAVADLVLLRARDRAGA